MDDLKKWMIIRFTPYQTTILLNWMFSQKLSFKLSLLLNGKCGIQVYVPQTTATTTFACSSVFILLLWQKLFNPSRTPYIERTFTFTKVSQYNAKDQDKTWTAVGTRKSKTCFRNRVFDKYFSFSFQLEKSTASEKGLIKSTPDSRSSGPGFEFGILLCEKT